MSSGNASRPLKVGRLCFQRIALLLRCLTKGITLHDATHHRFSFYLASSPRYPLSFEATLTASLGESRPRFSEWGWIASECDYFCFLCACYAFPRVGELKMKLGFFTMPIHPLGKDWRVTLKEDREAFILADELGFTEAYCGEHVTDRAENITSCGLFLAWIAKDIKQMRLGTGTINLPNSHPAAVAGQIAMLDHMLDGRFNFGVSPGGLLSDAEIFGNLDADRNAMFVEGIDAVLKIWEGRPPYAIEGRFWKITTEQTMMEEIGQGVVAKPLQKPYPPIMVTVVAPHSKGVTEAASRGWLPISANFLLPKWVATHWPKYVEGRERVGAVADSNDWRVAKSVFVANDLATARDYALGPKSPYRFYYSQLLTKMKANRRASLFKADPNMSDDDLTVDGVLDDLVIWGTPDKVADELIQFQETVGQFGTLLYAGKDWVDPALARRSMVLLAEKVIPNMRTIRNDAAA
jgi:alkanesulfonate monooxygenase SsuD/methylene tetrahydromethanopterin reductase-like flavin-dependent oxidoreductase (luciferase family)